MRKLVLSWIVITMAGFVFPAYSQIAGKINIPCFIYHRFADDRYPSTNITLPEFESHLKYLKQNNFNPVSGTTHLVPGKNPPVLKLHLAAPGLINTKALQCFIAGSDNCSVQYDNAAEIITMQSEDEFSQRRTLYTITAPSATNSGVWYWCSYLWIEKSLDD